MKKKNVASRGGARGWTWCPPPSGLTTPSHHAGHSMQCGHRRRGMPTVMAMSTSSSLDRTQLLGVGPAGPAAPDDFILSPGPRRQNTS